MAGSSARQTLIGPTKRSLLTTNARKLNAHLLRCVKQKLTFAETLRARRHAASSGIATDRTADRKCPSVVRATRQAMDEGLSSQRLGEMQCLIYAAQTRRWYREPTDEDEQYAARYVDLLEAATLAGDERCNELAAALTKLRATPPFKTHLPIP